MDLGINFITIATEFKMTPNECVNERLEILSDMVRKGEPIGLLEALEVIEYQERLKQVKREQKSNSFFSKIKQFLRSLYGVNK